MRVGDVAGDICQPLPAGRFGRSAELVGKPRRLRLLRSGRSKVKDWAAAGSGCAVVTMQKSARDPTATLDGSGPLIGPSSAGKRCVGFRLATRSLPLLLSPAPSSLGPLPVRTSPSLPSLHSLLAAATQHLRRRPGPCCLPRHRTPQLIKRQAGATSEDASRLTTRRLRCVSGGDTVACSICQARPNLRRSSGAPPHPLAWVPCACKRLAPPPSRLLTALPPSGAEHPRASPEAGSAIAIAATTLKPWPSVDSGRAVGDGAREETRCLCQRDAVLLCDGRKQQRFSPSLANENVAAAG